MPVGWTPLLVASVALTLVAAAACGARLLAYEAARVALSTRFAELIR